MLAPPNGIPSARSREKTRRKMMDTTIPNTENALAIQYFPRSSPSSNKQYIRRTLSDKMGKRRV